jgi:hypothetical protein
MLCRLSGSTTNGFNNIRADSSTSPYAKDLAEHSSAQEELAFEKWTATAQKQVTDTGAK